MVQNIKEGDYVTPIDEDEWTDFAGGILKNRIYRVLACDATNIKFIDDEGDVRNRPPRRYKLCDWCKSDLWRTINNE